LELLRNAIAENWKTIITRHALVRMMERGIAHADVEDIIRKPTYVVKYNESESFPGRTNFRVAGKNDWSVVICIDYESEQIIVVTVID